jgi:hypothetical protein
MYSVFKIIRQRKTQLLAAAFLASFGLALSDVPPVIAQDKTFVPSGHTYAPNRERLPYPNSRLGRLQAEADIYETEIYRRQLEESKTMERFNRFIDRDFYRPDQLN